MDAAHCHWSNITRVLDTRITRCLCCSLVNRPSSSYSMGVKGIEDPEGKDQLVLYLINELTLKVYPF